MKMINDYSKYNIEAIKNAIDINLVGSKNPIVYHHYENDRIWDRLMTTIEDESFMSIIIFNNDYLHTASVHTFSSYYLMDVDNLTNFDKNSVGRFWKLVFKTLGYNKESRLQRSSTIIKVGKLFSKE